MSGGVIVGFAVEQAQVDRLAVEFERGFSRVIEGPASAFFLIHLGKTLDPREWEGGRLPRASYVAARGEGPTFDLALTEWKAQLGFVAGCCRDEARREGRPGDCLVWRRRPCLARDRNHERGQESWEIYARFAVI